MVSVTEIADKMDAEAIAAAASTREPPLALDGAARRLARARSALNRAQREYDEARVLAHDKERALGDAQRAYGEASAQMIRSAEAAESE